MDLLVIWLGLVVGFSKAFLFLAPGHRVAGKSEASRFFCALSLPFIALAILFQVFWPGNLAGSFAFGALFMISGAALLGYAFLLADRAVLLDRNLMVNQDHWATPFDLQPFGARWGWPEEVLVALLFGPLAVALVRATQSFSAFLLLFGGWMGLVLPMVAIRLVVISIKATRGQEADFDSPFLFKPGLNRSCMGLISIAMALLGGCFVYLGLLRLV